jgi:hypothetical protein
MAQVKVRPNELEALVEAALGRASGAIAPELARSADLLNQRAARLEAAADRLEAGLGAGDPEVTGLRRAASATATLAAAAGQARARREKLSTPTAETWVVFGRVLQADGGPAAGLQVRAVGHAEDHQVALDPTQTDDDGDFALVYRDADLAEPRPDLSVQVEDAKGKLLAASPDQLRFQLGQAEYVQLVLPVSRRGGRAAQRPARASAKRPTGRRAGGRRAKGAGPAAEGREGT